MINRNIGDAGEEYVCRIYKKNGFKILSRNYRTRFGELDIIAHKKNLVVIVEVKARAVNTMVPLEFSITTAKQKKVRTTASIYLSSNELMDNIIRFDAAFVVHHDGNPVSCEIIENAF